MSRWSHWSRGTEDKGKDLNSFLKENMPVDMGNPAVTAGQNPADRARALGLQSNGKGGYIDPQSGQLVARTVNNELVFYDDNGGVVSDGGGGMALTQAQPSWSDPVTGALVVPPGKPRNVPPC